MDAIIKDGLGTITPEEVIPAFPTPLVPGTEILNTVVKHLRVIMRHNFFPAILMAGGAVMALHYSGVVSTGGCPIVVAHGCSETGKSTAILIGLSLFYTQTHYTLSLIRTVCTTCTCTVQVCCTVRGKVGQIHVHVVHVHVQHVHVYTYMWSV